MAQKNWIQNLKKGGLHKSLGIPLGKTIPLSTVMSAAKRPGLVGEQARAALNLRGLRQGMPPSMTGGKKKTAKKSRKSKRASTKK